MIEVGSGEAIMNKHLENTYRLTGLMRQEPWSAMDGHPCSARSAKGHLQSSIFNLRLRLHRAVSIRGFRIGLTPR
jgi:hypothetical protein